MQASWSKSMADLFVAATEQWGQWALQETSPDFYTWCLAAQFLGTGPGQFKPTSADPNATTDPGFAKGASVTFVDGSVAVRDLDGLRQGRPADWHALPSLPEEVARRFQRDFDE